MDSVDRLSRRLKVSDLRLLHAVVQSGSMAKAAAQLNISQPAVSKAIANLEQTLGVRLLDRNSRGVESTLYGRALLKRGIAVFDELRQGVNDIKSLNDPSTGEVRIGATAAALETLLPVFIHRFSQKYPRVVLHLDNVPRDATYMAGLRDRKYDVVVAWSGTLLANNTDMEDLRVVPLFRDRWVIVAGAHSPWAARRKIDLAALVNEPWILPVPNSWNYSTLVDAFKARGMAAPKGSVITSASALRIYLIANGPYITSTPNSSVWLSPIRHQLSVLPVDLPIREYPLAVFAMKNRTLNPAVEHFIESTRDVAKSIAIPPRPRRN